jgi:trans-aconitate methyltransferase
MPNDDAELERLNIVHHMLKKALGNRIHLAPLPSGSQRVLDLGTGTGIWAIEMADTYPQAEILGNDLSASQPSWVPPNVRFEVDDFESTWAYGISFDFVFGRTLCCSVANWPQLVKQAYENIRPGGLVEFEDYNLRLYSEDGTLRESGDLVRWSQLLMDCACKLGKEPSPGPHLEDWMKEAGFVNVVHQKFKLPVGPWAKDKRQVRYSLRFLFPESSSMFKI